ncbi:Hypothetical protein R9X50_00333700 [Acrodontium crateriforme]|uniref:Nucleotide-diphospho-sugar transferase n=1 Tax=Acrodontium crateriforme TaxID=150365 RepID=A0AAQ3RBS1_9PEZI|nr:Hypothetical protein R9X50_00333700 [Acrodontium crateriforme]
MHTMTSRFSAPSGELKWRKDFDTVDDQLHDMHHRDDDGIQWPKFRRSKTLPVLGVFVVVLIMWKIWPAKTSLDWSRYAYVQYATDEHNLCNALMVFEALERHGSKADRVLLHHPEWATRAEGGVDHNSDILTRAERNYRVKLKAVQVLDSRGDVSKAVLNGQPSTWDTSVTKLRAFELTEYERVIMLDSDITLLDKIDELFLLPKTPMAAPRAYWMNTAPRPQPLTSLLMVLEPNKAEFSTMVDTMRLWHFEDSDRNVTGMYDMELVNNRFAPSALVLPHRPYALLTAEFRNKDHYAYLGTANGPHTVKQAWNAEQVLAEAKLIHFSDWPLPKPWMMWPEEGLLEMQPDCESSRQQCPERDIWKQLYIEFRERRKKVCRTLPIEAPNWMEWKVAVGASEAPQESE